MSKPPLNKRTASTTLLDLSVECRGLILDMVLQNKARVWDDRILDENVSPIHLHIPRIPGEGEDTPRYTISKDRIHIGNVKIILVCRQLYSEGVEVLYGRNSFVSYNFPQLKYRLPAVVGRRNMRLIRRVTLGLPMKHKRGEPTAYLGGFLEFLKDKIPNLVELTLTTQFGRFGGPFVDDGINTRIGEEYRAMLNTSAWVTCRHPRLKKAIWLAESGGIPFKLYPGGDDSDDDYFLSPKSGADEEFGHSDETLGIPNSQSGPNNDGTADMVNAPDGNESNTDWDQDAPQSDPIHRSQSCRLTVKILAEDRRHRIRTKFRIDLLPRFGRAIATVC